MGLLDHQLSQGSLEEIRPGRTLFFQKVVLGAASPPESTANNNDNIQESSKHAVLVNLVIVHGTCASHNQFHKLLEALQSQLEKSNSSSSSLQRHNHYSIHCYLWDAMGCGQSPAISDWNAFSTHEAVLDLQAILQEKIDDADQQHPTILMGHSYGPNVILNLLLQQQQQQQQHTEHNNNNNTTSSSSISFTPRSNVSGLILLSTGFKDGPIPLADGGHPIMKLPLFLLKCLQPTLTKEFIKLAYHPDVTTPASRDASRRANNANPMWVAQAYHRHHQWITTEQAKQATVLGSTIIPCLVLHGTSDGVLPLECGQYVADQLRAPLIRIEPASHQIMEEQPDQVAQAILLFLQQIFTNNDNK